MSELKYGKGWLCLGLLWVLLVVYLSVTDLAFPQAGFDAGDKLNHLIAYGFLMGWFGQLVRSQRGRMFLIVGLCGLGLAMEFVQSALPHRWFDLLDAVANTVGILVGAGALYFGADKILSWFETKVICNVRS